eukprot:scaffold126301_cov31-Tisochrysis_lutea.AAC.2
MGCPHGWPSFHALVGRRDSSSTLTTISTDECGACALQMLIVAMASIWQASVLAVVGITFLIG